MQTKPIKKDDLNLDYSELSPSNLNYVSNYNKLRRLLLEELETIPDTKKIFDKYNVFFIDNDLNRINIDFPKLP